MQTPLHSADAPSQLNNMNQSQVLGVGLELLSLQEVAHALRLSRISIYRMVARRALSVYRVGNRIRFQKKDVMDYLEKNRYGSD